MRDWTEKDWENVDLYGVCWLHGEPRELVDYLQYSDNGAEHVMTTLCRVCMLGPTSGPPRMITIELPEPSPSESDTAESGPRRPDEDSGSH